jgi:hypothetical protein
VDLAAAEAARPEGGEPRSRPAAAWCSWTGDAEPIPFPFRPGLVTESIGFGFDADGGWLVVAGRDGGLHGIAFDDSPPEVLPRAYLGGAVLREVVTVLGVSGGVVVAGVMSLAGGSIPGPIPPTLSTTIVTPGVPVAASSASPPAPAEPARMFVAAHYDRAARRVTLHVLGPAWSGSRWSAYPDLNCVAVRTPAGADYPGCAIDLATLGRFPGPEDAGLVSRARLAWDRSEKGGSPPRELPVHTRWSHGILREGPHLHLDGNMIRVRWADPPWVPFEVTRDGQPFLAGAEVRQAQLAGDVLALLLSRRHERTLALFRGPDGALLSEMRHAASAPFALSADGRRLARGRGRREVVVTEVPGSGPPLAVAERAKLHDGLGLFLAADPFRLTIRVGSFAHTFRLDGDRLSYASAWDPTYSPPKRQPPGTLPTGYDPGRFPPHVVVEAGPWRVVPDRLGQVLLFTEAGTLVAAFLVRRERWAVWAPGGVFWGDPVLIGGPPSPAADEKIGRALAADGG